MTYCFQGVTEEVLTIRYLSSVSIVIPLVFLLKFYFNWTRLQYKIKRFFFSVLGELLKKMSESHSLNLSFYYKVMHLKLFFKY